MLLAKGLQVTTQVCIGVFGGPFVSWQTGPAKIRVFSGSLSPFLVHSSYGVPVTGHGLNDFEMGPRLGFDLQSEEKMALICAQSRHQTVHFNLASPPELAFKWGDPILTKIQNSTLLCTQVHLFYLRSYKFIFDNFFLTRCLTFWMF